MKARSYHQIYLNRFLYFIFIQLLISGLIQSQTTFTFNYTGSTQTLNLQAGTYSVQMWGGDGYTQTSGFNGRGGYASGILTLNTQQVIHIYVGGAGNFPSGGVTPNTWTFNGGGIGYPANNSLYGNGGGATDIRTTGGAWDNAASLASRVIVAGGGGAGRNSSYIGGHGGGLVGGTGTFFSPDQPGGPTGGSQSAGGTNTGYTSGLTQATLGKAMTWDGNTLTANFLAGGGGGYYGGGSGRVAGGGGSSYIGGVSSGTTSMFGQAGYPAKPVVSGDGYVIITRLCSINLYVNNGSNPNNAICSGNSATITTDAISNYTWSTGSNASSIVVTPTTSTIYSLTATSPSNCVTSAATTVIVSGAAPVLTVNASSPTVCLGNTVSISASGALSYTFSGGISNGVAFTPTATTTYTVAGQNGCGTATALSTITIAPLPVVGLASPSVVCAGSSASLSGGGATTYTWSPGNIVGASILVSPQVNTTYTVVGGSGNCIGINTVAMVANPVPTLISSASNSLICDGETVTLTASGALNYTWQPGNQTGSSIVVTPNIPTAYQVSGDNSFGCISTIQQPIIVFAGPTINISSSTPTICSGGTAILNASGANSYTWSTGPNTSSISVSPLSPTVYSVAGTNTTTQCSSTKTFEVNVLTPAISISSSTAVCIGNSATLNATGADSYQWNTGSTGSSIVVTPQNTTVYSVTGLVNAGSISCSATANATVTVNPLPVITAVASRSNICKNESTTIGASGGTSYIWNNAATTTSITVSPTINTTYSVEGTDANGCKNTASIFIRVYACVGLDEHETLSASIKVYPNPAKEVLYIEGKEQAKLSIINELGQVVLEFELNADNGFRQEVRGLAAGMYFVRNGQSMISRFLVQ